MSGLTSTPILAGSMMICVLILGGVLILLAGYGLFPSPDLLFVLLLLAFLAASMLVIALAEVVRNYCCRGSDAQNLHPDLRTRRDVLNETRSRARWFQSGCCQTARPDKETPKEKEHFESEANQNGAPSLAAYRALLQPQLFGLDSAWPFEHPQGEVVAEVLPEMAEGADAGAHLDAVGGGPRVQMFIGDDNEFLDGPNLPNESVVVAVDVEEEMVAVDMEEEMVAIDMEEKVVEVAMEEEVAAVNVEGKPPSREPPSRVLKGLGPVLGYKRGVKS